MYWQLIEVKMQHLIVLIRQAANRHKELKQELAFVITSKQCWAKRLATFHKMIESNTAIIKDLAMHGASLPAHQDHNNKDDKLVLGHK